jgi:hypothetical protein
MGNPGSFPTANLPYPGARALRVTRGFLLSHPILKSKSDAHHMYAQDQVVIHTARM